MTISIRLTQQTVSVIIEALEFYYEQLEEDDPDERLPELDDAMSEFYDEIGTEIRNIE